MEREKEGRVEMEREGRTGRAGEREEREGRTVKAGEREEKEEG